MSASVTSSPTPRAANSNATQDTRRPARTKKPRAIRRRGRARDGIESDNEIERVVSSDSDSDSDESLSTDSATDSESASEDELPDRTTHTPNTSHSPITLEKAAIINGNPPGDFFSTSGDWSEMVADENANGAAELPVIEFSDFKADAVPPSQRPTRKPKKVSKKKAQVSSVSALTPGPETTSEPPNGDVAERVSQDKQDDKDSPQRLPSQLKRPVGQSARQVYQQKLESDPSFVPKVGGFWGHDDRLIDKDLRSLSGWWRGRWQGRGRGRGGFISGSKRYELPTDEGNKEEIIHLPPIERTWGHDGFEEMKRKEEQRLESQVRRQSNPSLRGSARGRGGAIATRGGRADFPRGGPANPGNRAAAAAKAGRVWYAMKPELMWTKQSDNFLFYASSKQRAAGTLFRVQLPGSGPHVIREQVLSDSPGVPLPNHVAVATASVVGSDIDDDAFVIKLPKRTEEEEPPTTVDEASLEDVFKVRPHLVNPEPIPLPTPSNTKTSPPDGLTHRSQPSTSAADPDSAARSQLEQLSLDLPSTDPTRWAQTEKAVLRKPTGEAPAEETPKSPTSENHPRRPSLPPIQTVYSPPPAQPSPVYTSSYGYPALPPGIALNQHGMPYEISTGRPVYLPVPAPPPMYNPRPVMHSHVPQHSISYMTPPHMHPSSAISPDFIAHQPSSHSHTPSVAVSVNGFIDPTTGIPMFSLPRSSRIEIRAPGEDSNKSINGTRQQPITSPRGPSHLRASSASYTHSPSHPGAEYGYHSYSSSSDLGTLPAYGPVEASGPVESLPNTTTQAMPPYMPYPQYYYPDPAYGYPQYMDMSQAGQYEMYPPMETHGTTYY